MYKHLLVGLDLAPGESRALATKALELARALGADLHFIHVIEPLTFAYAGDIPIDIGQTQMAMERHAKAQLQELLDELGAGPDRLSVVVGMTADELRNAAADRGADVIVVGSHGRAGLALIMGNTASHVLRGAACDVLAMRI